MKVCIHRDNYNINRFNQKYEEILKINNIPFEIVDINDADFWEKIKSSDLFIFRWFHFDNDRMLARAIIPVIENNLNLRLFPDYNTCWHFDDKIKQYYLLSSAGFPYTDSWIFWDRSRASEWIKNAKYPLIFKLKGGAGSNNVIKVENIDQARTLIRIMFGKGVTSGHLPVRNSIYRRSMFITLEYNFRLILKRIVRTFKGQDVTPTWQKHKNYILFQKYLPKNDFDTRITVIGKRAFGFRRINRLNDFRASGSGNLDHDNSKIDLRCVELAFKISQELKFQSMAYDFLYNEDGGIEICEISYSFQDKAIYYCPGYWDQELNWHEGHFLPQYCQLSDLLSMPELIQPDNIIFN